MPTVKKDQMWITAMILVILVCLMSWNCFNCVRLPSKEGFATQPYVMTLFNNSTCTYGSHFGPFGDGKMYTRNGCQADFNAGGYRMHCRSDAGKFTVCPIDKSNPTKIPLPALAGYTLEDDKNYSGADIAVSTKLQECAEKCKADDKCKGFVVKRHHADPDNPIERCFLKGEAMTPLADDKTFSTYKKNAIPLPVYPDYIKESQKDYQDIHTRYMPGESTTIEDCKRRCNADMANCAGFVVDALNGTYPVQKCNLLSKFAFIHQLTSLQNKDRTIYKKKQQPITVPAWADAYATKPIIYTTSYKAVEYCNGGCAIELSSDSMQIKPRRRYAGEKVFYIATKDDFPSGHDVKGSIFFYAHTSGPVTFKVGGDDKVAIRLFKFYNTEQKASVNDWDKNFRLVYSTEVSPDYDANLWEPNIYYYGLHSNWKQWETEGTFNLETGNAYVLELVCHDDGGSNRNLHIDADATPGEGAAYFNKGIGPLSSRVWFAKDTNSDTDPSIRHFGP